MQWVKKRGEDPDRTIEISATHWGNMKKHELEIRKAITTGQKFEIPLIDTGNKTLQHQFLEGNKTWYIGFTTYFSGTRNCNRKYTMNILPAAFLALMSHKEAIDCLIEHFAKERKRDQFGSAPKVQLANRMLQPREFITFSWKHVDRETDEVVRNNLLKFWSEDLAMDQAHRALPQEELHKIKIEITKQISEMPDQFALTKYCAFLLVYLDMRKKNNVRPCNACKNKVCDETVIFPCLDCLKDDIPKSKYWRVEPELRHLLDSYEFKNALGQLLEYIRTNFCQTRLYGRHLAEAFVEFSHYRIVKLDFWRWLNENEHTALLENLRYSWIMACDKMQKEREKSLKPSAANFGPSYAAKRQKI